MSAATPISPLAAKPPALFMRRFTVAEYHHMIQSGVFAHDERFELLEGWIIAKMSRNPPHDASLDQTQEELRRHLPAGWRVRIQSAITTADSEPEPDIAVVKGTARTYSRKHPAPEDTALVIEIAESSLLEDRRDKVRIYARAGIQVYWIINLVQGVVEVYSQPSGPSTAPAYLVRDEYRLGQSMPLVIDGKQLASIAVADVLP